MGQSREVWEEFAHLEPGHYYCFIECDWPADSEHTDLCVSSYGASDVYFLRDEKSLFAKNDILRQLYRSCALQGKCSQSVADMSDSGAREIKRYFGQTEEGYLYCHVENRDKEATYSESLAFVSFDALELLMPQKGSSFDITVGPNSHKTVLIRQ